MRHNTREKTIIFCLAGEGVVEIKHYSITQNLNSVIPKVAPGFEYISFNFTYSSGHNTHLERANAIFKFFFLVQQVAGPWHLCESTHAGNQGDHGTTTEMKRIDLFHYLSDWTSSDHAVLQRHRSRDTGTFKVRTS